MIEKKSAYKTGEVPESAKKPKSTEPGQSLKPPDNLPVPSSQRPEPAAQQANQSGLNQTSKTSDDVPHVKAEIVDETKNGNGGDNLPYKRLKIPEDQIPSVLGLEQNTVKKKTSWWRVLFVPIDAQKIIELLRRSLVPLRKKSPHNIGAKDS